MQLKRARSFLQKMPKEDERVDTIYDAAARGDEEACRRLVAQGADVNVPSEDGRTVISCLLLGECTNIDDASNASPTIDARRRILAYLLEHGQFSLYALNAPQDALRRVTPLSLAAYLDREDWVSVMLDCSHGLVSVDAVDMHNATPLMYAARDGNLKVVETLLYQGARPHIRDLNHRSALQFAVNHPPSLWLCENALRRQRAAYLLHASSSKRMRLSVHLDKLELQSLITKTPPSFVSPSNLSAISSYTESLIDAVASSDSSAVQSLLLSAIASNASHNSDTTQHSVPSDAIPLLNRFDQNGWSPMHYCVTVPRPRADILDLLFLFGADVSLFTPDNHSTPLHCLARTANVMANDVEGSALGLYSFILHLVKDLRAPLGVRDQNEDTPMHVAAQHGQNIVVLMALLDCDPTKTVAKMRNSRGLTPFDVAKPEFRIAFSAGESIPRPGSSASDRTIRPMQSMSSFASTSSTSSPVSSTFSRSSPWGHHHSSSSDSNLPSSSTLPLAKEVLEDLEARVDVESGDLDYLQESLQQTESLANVVIKRFHKYADDAQSELKECLTLYDRVDTLVDKVEGIARRKKQYESPTGTRGRSISLTGTTVVGSSIFPSKTSLLPVEQKSFYSSKDLNVPESTNPRKSFSQTWSSIFRPFSSPNPPVPAVPEQHKTKPRSFSYSNLKSKISKSSMNEKKSPERTSPYGDRLLSPASHADLRGAYVKLEAELNDGPRTVMQSIKRDMRSVDRIMSATDGHLCQLRKMVLDAQQLTSETIKARENIIESERLLQALNDLLILDDPLSREEDYNTFEHFTSAPPCTPIDPPQSFSFPVPTARIARPVSSVLPVEQDENVRTLRHLLLEGIPAKLDAILDDMEKSSDWLMIIRGVIRDFYVKTVTIVEN